MEIKRTEKGKITIFHLIGEIDLYCSQDFKEQIKGALAEGKRSIILDCTELSYIDSSGIGVLISLLTTLRKSGGDLVLCALQSTVRSVIHYTKLEGFQPIEDTLEEPL